MGLHRLALLPLLFDTKIMILITWYFLNKTARGQELAARIGEVLLAIARRFR